MSPTGTPASSFAATSPAHAALPPDLPALVARPDGTILTRAEHDADETAARQLAELLPWLRALRAALPCTLAGALWTPEWQFCPPSSWTVEGWARRPVVHLSVDTSASPAARMEALNQLAAAWRTTPRTIDSQDGTEVIHMVEAYIDGRDVVASVTIPRGAVAA